MKSFKYRGRAFALPFVILAFGVSACDGNEDVTANISKNTPPLLNSLDVLTIPALRSRDYNSQITIKALTHTNCIGEVERETLPEANSYYSSFMAGFSSDGIEQYARITIPDTAPPAGGYPFILFLHGYVGQDKAPNYSIGCNPDNLYYSELTDAFARSGYAVLSPGYRGHGTVDGIPAQGIEYLQAFDEGAGLSTQYYAIDALNFVSGLADIESDMFPDHAFIFDTNQFYLFGHSQGGDAGLTYLAAVGEGRHEELEPVKAALWSGTFLDRLTALEKMMPMALTSQAFLSGDGTWTGTAEGKDGSINPSFIFGFPPDWVETPNPENWTWQVDVWSETTVKSAIQKVTTEMYEGLSKNVTDLGDLKFSISDESETGLMVQHDPRIADIFPKIGGYKFDVYLREPLQLHVPQKDYYSQTKWNTDLCERINDKPTSASCDVIIYPHNNHSMRASQHSWFTPPGTPDGYPAMIANLVNYFSQTSEERP